QGCEQAGPLRLLRRCLAELEQDVAAESLRLTAICCVHQSRRARPATSPRHLTRTPKASPDGKKARQGKKPASSWRGRRSPRWVPPWPAATVRPNSEATSRAGRPQTFVCQHACHVAGSKSVSINRSARCASCC